MNCRPNELAIIIRSVLGKSVGHIVETLYLLPVGPCSLPSGETCINPGDKDLWVIKSQRPLERTDGIMSLYSCSPDAWLRSIRGEPETVDSETHETA